MSTFFRFSHAACAIVLGAAFATTWAQQAPGVLKGSQVTESALVDALQIEGPAAPEDSRLRGFAPARRVGGDPVRPPSAGKANVMITFQTDSAELTPEGTRILDTVAKALQSDKLAGFAFTIEGHADPRGSVDHNLVLSQSRAQAVVDYLVKVHGVLPERLAAVGKGSTELLDTARPDSPENRRVTIVTNR